MNWLLSTRTCSSVLLTQDKYQTSGRKPLSVAYLGGCIACACTPDGHKGAPKSDQKGRQKEEEEKKRKERKGEKEEKGRGKGKEKEKRKEKETKKRKGDIKWRKGKEK